MLPCAVDHPTVPLSLSFPAISRGTPPTINQSLFPRPVAKLYFRVTQHPTLRRSNLKMSTLTLGDPQLNALLDKLHSESESQDYSLLAFSAVRSVLESIGLKWFVPGSAWYDSFYRSKYVALERDKANFCYLLIRALNAKTVVECGTSFGVSTIYLAAGVRDNSHEERGVVIATENEAEKIVKAKETWEKAGLSGYIKLLEGDIRTTLKDVHLDDPVEFVLMDIWTPLALPSLKNLLPKMKKGNYPYICGDVDKSRMRCCHG